MVYYTKPKDVSYTQMCIWIDENAYKEDCDDYLLFQYLYHLVGMLAFKRGLFNKNSIYNDFAVYGATTLFMRLKNPKQFIDESSKDKLPKIKSILNYAKKKVYPLKVSFEQENYAQVLSKETVTPVIQNATLYEPAHNDQYTTVEFISYVSDIPKTIKTYIYSKPLAHLFGSPHDLYISVLLTFINSVTLPKDVASAVRESSNALYRNPRIVDRVYRHETENPVILYNISKRYRGLVLVLYREVCDLISRDIDVLYKTHQYGEAVVKNMLLNSVFETGDQNA